MDDFKDIRAKEITDIADRVGGLYNYVSLKTEKLTAALYLVTDYISDNEPLKWKLRTRALDLLAGVPSVQKDMSGSAGWERYLLGVNEIVSYLAVGTMLGGVSRMNFEILREEYRSLQLAVEDQASRQSLRDYLFVRNLRSAKPVDAVSDAPFKQSSNLNSADRPVGRELPRPHIGQKDNKVLSANDLYGLNTKDNKKSIRKEQIISWLKDKPWTSIAEIAKALPDCGAKTVQRELLEMVSLGVLKKQGERRWSRYMLNDER
jgi:hypothetical protein